MDILGKLVSKNGEKKSSKTCGPNFNVKAARRELKNGPKFEQGKINKTYRKWREKIINKMALKK